MTNQQAAESVRDGLGPRCGVIVNSPGLGDANTLTEESVEIMYVFEDVERRDDVEFVVRPDVPPFERDRAHVGDSELVLRVFDRHFVEELLAGDARGAEIEAC